MLVETGYYKHFKGNIYQVIGVGKHSETGEELVVYKGLYDSPHGYGAIWLRPVAMFLGEARPGIQRFKKITDDEASLVLEAQIEVQ